MNYFFVFQNKSFHLEFNGGYLWAPKQSSNGRTPSHWLNMKNVKKGDIIINGYNKNITAISIALSDCYDSIKPYELKSTGHWDESGMKVDCRYFLLSTPLAYKDLLPIILELQPKKYAPFNKLGKGNTGYLFDINEELCSYFLSKLNQYDKPIIDQLKIKPLLHI